MTTRTLRLVGTDRGDPAEEKVLARLKAVDGFSGVTRVAAATGLTEAAVTAALTAMEKKGLVGSYRYHDGVFFGVL